MGTARRRRRVQGTTAAAAAALALAACSPGATNSSAEDDDALASGATTVTFRLWDEVAAPAYAESFDAFTAQNPDIQVEIETVPWADYWERLPLDISSGEMADIFWTNTSNFGRYADSGDLINISDAIGDDHDKWVESVTDLYERNGSLWGVPQLWDSIALYYNTQLVEDAGVDPTELTWQPPADEGQAVGPNDTLLAASRALTTDTEGRHPGDEGFDRGSTAVYGFNAQADLQAIYRDFLAQNGAQFQEGDEFAFATPEGEEAFQYLVDLINTHHVAPSAADTNTNPNVTRDLFLQGRLGLFQSGPYNLRRIADSAEFEWGLAPLVEGPEGRISVVHGVAAVGNANSDNVEATTEVLRWLGSADGQSALASQGVAFPAAVAAQETFVDYWAERGVDVQVFIDAAQEPTAPAPVGPDVNAGLNAVAPILQDMFLGDIPVARALQQAQEAGNEAMED
ncbi:sugar ABC transporter substrate-binding protein [Georgenia halophila]|uniref:Sugar ABC transporter substrate-binding protein n=1 Tax=Georgenia halophila TaxID=620889 RepID=A0ABP8LHX4_9MICO